MNTSIKRKRGKRHINSQAKRLVKQYRNLQIFLSAPDSLSTLARALLAMSIFNYATRFIQRTIKKSQSV
ncbi:hypothetical protein [Nitrosomonas sp.]|uniref:hypothetical protein n=1 Tax=Nitrosomonas sp. TaxID=42353 RepID=UPI00374D3899